MRLPSNRTKPKGVVFFTEGLFRKITAFRWNRHSVSFRFIPSLQSMHFPLGCTFILLTGCKDK